MNSLILVFDIEGAIFTIRAIRLLFFEILPSRDDLLQMCYVLFILLPILFSSVFILRRIDNYFTE